MQIVRAFWGDMNTTYSNQIIDSINDKLNEIVYVWGKENYEFITSKGFMCVLVSEEPYDYTISSAHHFHDYRNLHHKLISIDMSTKEFGEILFLDWDCRLVKPLDDNFVETLRSSSPIQAPLYVYPKSCLNTLIEEESDEVMSKFFDKLKITLEKYSYDWNDCYVVPNTGFVYCRDSNISSTLCELSNNFDVEPLVDEFSLYIYANSSCSLEGYVEKFEPSLISGKLHGNDIWDKYQHEFNSYFSKIKNKNIYFVHK